MAIVLPILTTYNAAGVKAAQTSLKGIGGTLATLGKQVVGATIGFQALQGAINFAGDAISQARDLERNMSALNTVFGDLAPGMETFAKNAYQMGLSQVDAARTATFLGSVLKQAGLPMDQVAQKTEELTILAQDLATTYGYDTSEALTAMTALFRGEYDPIEKFGVALKQNEVNALVAAKGLGHLTGQEMLNAQQTVRMEQLFLRSADAAGAFARQTGTLFVEQKKLTAVFSNMQATVGAQLTPEIAQLMQTLTPLVQDLTPRLEESFRLLGENIENLVPSVRPLADILFTLLDVVNGVAEAMMPLADNLSSILMVALEDIAAVIERAVYWFDQLTVAIDNMNLSVDETKPAPITDWLKGIGDRLGELNLLSIAMNGFKNQVESVNVALAGTDETGRLIRRRLESLGAVGPSSSTASSGASAKKITDYVGNFYKSLNDEIAKQQARSTLKNKGLSQEFIESIVGSGKGWEKVFNDIKGKSAKALAALQKTFTKTEAGQKEVAALQKKLQDEADARFEKAMDQYNDQLRIYEAQVDAIKSLKRSLSEAAQATVPLAVVTREIGSFESATISAFENIADVIAKSLADGTILKSAADNLTAYANKEKTVIADLMRQRDVVANKRSLAKAMLDDVRAAITGMQNITNILGNQAGDITQSVTKMVGGLQVTTSKVIKGIVGGGAKELVSSFSDIVARTKTFAEQLKQLRALGLDKNLYQQIVDAGIDAGGQTAKAILEGGAGTVNELNTLFNELDLAGQDIAKNSAEVMFGAGVDLTNGLIEGLISQEQQLVDTATRLAEAFTAAFNAQVSVQVPMPTAPIMPTAEIVPIVTAPQITVPKSTPTSKKTGTTTINNTVVLKPAAGIVTKKDGIAVARAISIATKAGTLTKGAI